MLFLRPTIALFALAAPAFAATLAARQTGCSPNFAGHPVSILYANGGTLEELTVAGHTSGANIITQVVSALSPEFLIENSGHSPASYIIKDQTAQSLVAYATTIPRADAPIKLNPIDNSGTDERQYWFITCTTCADPTFPVPAGGVFGTSCQIQNSGLGWCVQRAGPVGTPPALAPCTAVEDTQKFNFRREFL